MSDAQPRSRGGKGSKPSKPSKPAKSKKPAAAEGGEELPEGAARVFVTDLTPVEHQVGTNVVAALQQPNTVAVLTTVMLGPGGHQRLVSVGIDPERLGLVREVLEGAEEAQTDRIPCVGFHCWLEDKDAPGDAPEPEDEGGARPHPEGDRP